MASRFPLEVNELVGTAPRGERQQVQVRRCRSVTGLDYVDLRVWERTWGASPYKATKRGLTLMPELVPALIEALQKVVKR